MTPVSGVKDFKWQLVEMRTIKASKIPETSGVYIVAGAVRVRGFPREMTPLYVGQTNNLRRRFLDHVDVRRSHNLSVLLQSFKGSTEFWWASCEARDLIALERDLIRELKPEYNQITYMAGEKHVEEGI